jgi:hypothetical protein
MLMPVAGSLSPRQQHMRYLLLVIIAPLPPCRCYNWSRKVQQTGEKVTTLSSVTTLACHAHPTQTSATMCTILKCLHGVPVRIPGADSSRVAADAQSGATSPSDAAGAGVADQVAVATSSMTERAAAGVAGEVAGAASGAAEVRGWHCSCLLTRAVMAWSCCLLPHCAPSHVHVVFLHVCLLRALLAADGSQLSSCLWVGIGLVSSCLPWQGNLWLQCLSSA